MEKTNELKIKIRNKDKEGLQKDFQVLRSSIDPEMERHQYSRFYKIIQELEEYILEEVE